MSRWWQHRTLRFRLAVWYAAVGTVLLLGFGLAIYAYVARSLARPLDHQLRADFAAIERRLEIAPDGSLSWDGQPIDTESTWHARDPWFDLWNDRNELVHRAWPVGPEPTGAFLFPPVRGRESFSILQLNPAVRLRVLSLPFPTAASRSPWTLRVFHVHTPVGDTLDALAWIIGISLPVVIAALVFGGYALTRRWLKPLDRMADEACRIGASDLGRRLPVATPHDELGRLATVFNLTLDRLESAFRDLDRFVGDAAHELRSPLTALRNVGEVGLQRARSPEEYRNIIASMLEEEHRIQALVRRLLELAGAESGGRLGHREDIDLAALVRACADELAVLGEPRGQQIECTTCPATIHTDPVLLQQALRNLIDNAFKFSPDAGTVQVNLTEAGEAWRIDVLDRGPGISPEHRARLAERFFRAGRSNDPTRPGFGLGLSITKVYLRVLGGSMHYAPREGGGSCFSVKLPRTAAPAA